jgi:flagellar motor switch protein FliG
LERTDADTLREIEQALEARLARQFAIEPGRRSGPDVVARILAACSSRVAGGILDNLAEYDRTLAEQLGHKTMKFDDLIHLDDAVLSAVVEAVEPEVVQAALLGAPPSLVDRILRGMRPDDARRLGEKLSCPEPIRLSDVEEARRQIATLAHRMTYDCPIPTARAA